MALMRDSSIQTPFSCAVIDLNPAFFNADLGPLPLAASLGPKDSGRSSTRPFGRVQGICLHELLLHKHPHQCACHSKHWKAPAH